MSVEPVRKIVAIGLPPVRPGIYRRRIRIVAGVGEVSVDMEDDPHRYGVTLYHDGQCVTGIEGRALRTPWALCPSAVAMLPRLVGMPLSPRPTAVYQHTSGTDQCTHLFDTAGLAVAHAARGTTARQYDMEVSCPAQRDIQEAILHRDGVEVLRWTFRRSVVLAPERFAGQSFKRILVRAETECTDADDYEAIVLLQRASFTSVARYFDLDRMTVAGEIPLVGACFVYQPGVAERAARMMGSTRDFSGDADALLGDLKSGEGRG
jgi:hypothetical protein